jgi:hypothetical protein
MIQGLNYPFSFSLSSGFIDMLLGNLLLFEIPNHINIVRRIFISLGAFIFSVGYLAWEAPRLYVDCPNWFKSIWGLRLLLRPWFPTYGISLLSSKLTSGRKLISFYYNHVVNKLILLMDKLSMHLVYLLSQESNQINKTVVGNLHSCFCFGTKVLKRFHL